MTWKGVGNAAKIDGRMDGNIAESFSDLDCIFCLANGDTVNSIINIDKGELRWMTTNGLL